MNWLQSMYGAHILDYRQDEREQYITLSNKLISEEYDKLKLINKKKKKQGSFLVTPPIDNHINTASYYIGFIYYNIWMEKYFQSSGVTINHHSSELPSYNPLQRTCSTIFISFSINK
jgi:hypothetical protein